MNFTAIVFQIIVALSPNVDAVKAYDNLNMYYDAVAVIESDMNRYAVSGSSSASSYFQMTTGAFETAKRRAARHGWGIKAKYIGELFYEEQVALQIIDLYERRGTSGFMKLIAEGNLWAAKKAYYRWHHTNPDTATKKRAERIFKEKYYE